MQNTAYHNTISKKKNTANNSLLQANDNLAINMNLLNTNEHSIFNKITQRVIAVTAQPVNNKYPFCATSTKSYDKRVVNHVNTRLLIVEDDRLNQKVVSLFLKELNYQNIDLAGTGQQALSLLNSYHYDLVLLDIGLPDINGIELCQQMRQLSCCNLTPIIALTAYTNEEIDKECLSVGINNVLHKPINIDELDSTLTYWLSYRK